MANYVNTFLGGMLIAGDDSCSKRMTMNEKLNWSKQSKIDLQIEEVEEVRTGQEGNTEMNYRNLLIRKHLGRGSR